MHAVQPPDIANAVHGHFGCVVVSIHLRATIPKPSLMVLSLYYYYYCSYYYSYTYYYCYLLVLSLLFLLTKIINYSSSYHYQYCYFLIAGSLPFSAEIDLYAAMNRLIYKHASTGLCETCNPVSEEATGLRVYL